ELEGLVVVAQHDRVGERVRVGVVRPPVHHALVAIAALEQRRGDHRVTSTDTSLVLCRTVACTRRRRSSRSDLSRSTARRPSRAPPSSCTRDRRPSTDLLSSSGAGPAPAGAGLAPPFLESQTVH